MKETLHLVGAEAVQCWPTRLSCPHARTHLSRAARTEIMYNAAYISRSIKPILLLNMIIMWLKSALFGLEWSAVRGSKLLTGPFKLRSAMPQSHVSL